MHDHAIDMLRVEVAKEVEGVLRGFVAYVAEWTGQEAADAREEFRDWLAGELPPDVVMDPRHDDHSSRLSGKFLPEGEEELDDDARYGDDEND